MSWEMDGLFVRSFWDWLKLAFRAVVAFKFALFTWWLLHLLLLSLLRSLLSLGGVLG